MALIGDLVAKLKLDTKDFNNKLRQAASKMKSFATVIATGVAIGAAAIGITLVAAFVKLSSIVSETTDKVGKMWDQFNSVGGSNFGDFQALGYAAEQNSVSLDQVTSSIAKMQKFLGGDSSQSILQKLGLDSKTLQALSPEKQFVMIADAIAKIQDPTQRTNVAMQIFGRGATGIMALLRDNIVGLQDEFKSFGGQLTNEQAAAIDDYGDTVVKLGQVYDAFQLQLTALLAGPLKELLNWVLEYIKKSGGIGSVAKSFASATVSAIQFMLSGWDFLANAVDSVYLAVIKLTQALIFMSKIGTLGLSGIVTNVLTPIDSELAAKAEEVKARIQARQLGASPTAGLQNKLQAFQDGISGNNGTPSQVTVTNFDQLNNQLKNFQDQNMQQMTVKLDMGIKTEPGWQAKLLNSEQNKQVIVTTTTNLIASSALAGLR